MQHKTLAYRLWLVFPPRSDMRKGSIQYMIFMRKNYICYNFIGYLHYKFQDHKPKRKLAQNQPVIIMKQRQTVSALNCRLAFEIDILELTLFTHDLLIFFIWFKQRKVLLPHFTHRPFTFPKTTVHFTSGPYTLLPPNCWVWTSILC